MSYNAKDGWFGQMADPSEVVPKREYDLLFKLLLKGDKSVGKSCVMQTYCNDAFTDCFSATLGKRGHLKSHLPSSFSSVCCKIVVICTSRVHGIVAGRDDAPRPHPLKWSGQRR